MTQKIGIIIAYFGEWPEWFPVYLKTCAMNPGIDWFFFTDCDLPAKIYANTHFEKITLQEMSELCSRKLGVNLHIKSPYKMCDFKLCYGKIFEDYLAGFDFWGCGDVDVVYGNLNKFLSPEVLSNDLISFCADYISGHLCLIRNEPRFVNFFRHIPRFFELINEEEYSKCDELVFENGRPYADDQIAFPSDKFDGRVFAKEFYSTPFSSHIPWKTGLFKFPWEWYWLNGELTTRLDGVYEYPYLHFLRWRRPNDFVWNHGFANWKELTKIVYVDEHDLDSGFRISGEGIHPLSGKKRIDYIAPYPFILIARWKRRCRHSLSRLKSGMLQQKGR